MKNVLIFTLGVAAGAAGLYLFANTAWISKSKNNPAIVQDNTTRIKANPPNTTNP